jgi:ribosomal subunit interface protein
MEITFKGSQYELPAEVTERASSKMQSFRKYLGHNDELTHVYVELGKETHAHQSGDIWSASVRVVQGGKTFTAKSVAETIDTAVDSVVDDMSRELRKAKQRDKSLIIKGGQALKRMLRRG